MPSGSCFGSCSIEHRDIFLQKKDALIQHHRKRYITSYRGKDLRNIYGKDIPNTEDSNSLRQEGQERKDTS
ncbi:unnamed protein product [Acanthocheilonema viteae]|uniref:Uncharacterized protein n=1 Tax=Acanthocheilonema viteae TaxID=6277 RepID=A0A498SX06_ACAVI|nr:unnamed protein product [Acanthocheilonema viteae]